MSDHYQTLGVPRTATADEIKIAFRKLAHLHHPDKGGDAEKFKSCSAAYAELSDTDRRKAYDARTAPRQQTTYQGGADFGQGRTMSDDDLADALRHFQSAFGFGNAYTNPPKRKRMTISDAVIIKAAIGQVFVDENWDVSYSGRHGSQADPGVVLRKLTDAVINALNK